MVKALKIKTRERMQYSSFNEDCAFGDGWDSLEGAILQHLKIKDLECKGVEHIIRDLIKCCTGFKEWRRGYLRDSMEKKQ